MDNCIFDSYHNSRSYDFFGLFVLGGAVTVSVNDCKYFYKIKEWGLKLEKELKKLNEKNNIYLSVDKWNVKNIDELKKYLLSEEL